MPTPDSPALTLHYAANSRAFTMLWALEELGLPYQLHRVDIRAGEQREPAYLAVNPLGKVPAVRDDSFEGGPVDGAETGALLLWLADRTPQAALAPGPHHRRRADLLRWTFFSGSVMEPCLGEVFFKWDVPSGSVAWGSMERMTAALVAGLQPGPWLLGDDFSIADIAVGATARFGVNFGAMASEGPIAEYVARCEARPAFERAFAIEQREVQVLQAAADGPQGG